MKLKRILAVGCFAVLTFVTGIQGQQTGEQPVNPGSASLGSPNSGDPAPTPTPEPLKKSGVDFQSLLPSKTSFRAGYDFKTHKGSFGLWDPKGAIRPFVYGSYVPPESLDFQFTDNIGATDPHYFNVTVNEINVLQGWKLVEGLNLGEVLRGWQSGAGAYDIGYGLRKPIKFGKLGKSLAIDNSQVSLEANAKRDEAGVRTNSGRVAVDLQMAYTIDLSKKRGKVAAPPVPSPPPAPEAVRAAAAEATTKAVAAAADAKAAAKAAIDGAMQIPEGTPAATAAWTAAAAEASKAAEATRKVEIARAAEAAPAVETASAFQERRMVNPDDMIKAAGYWGSVTSLRRAVQMIPESAPAGSSQRAEAEKENAQVEATNTALTGLIKALDRLGGTAQPEATLAQSSETRQALRILIDQARAKLGSATGGAEAVPSRTAVPANDTSVQALAEMFTRQVNQIPSDEAAILQNTGLLRDIINPANLLRSAKVLKRMGEKFDGDRYHYQRNLRNDKDNDHAPGPIVLGSGGTESAAAGSGDLEAPPSRRIGFYAQGFGWKRFNGEGANGYLNLRILYHFPSPIGGSEAAFGLSVITGKIPTEVNGGVRRRTIDLIIPF